VALPGGEAAGPASALLDKLKATAKTWQDRIKPGAYTSPVSKTRILFDSEDVTREFTLHGTQFEFPDVNESYIQQRGFGSREYPLVCFFTGKDCDRLATAFEKMLCEQGVGKLEHPIYGTIPVVPFGKVSRSDALKTAANQSVVTATFLTTTGAVYPSSKRSALNEINAAIEGFNVAAAQQFVGNTSLNSIGKALAAANTFRTFLKKTKAALKKASNAVAKVRKDFANGVAELNEGMDVLIGQPLLLAQQCANLIQAPGRALAGLESRLEGYDLLLESVLESVEGAPDKLITNGSILANYQAKVANDFHISSLFALSAVSGTVVSVTAQPIGKAFQISTSSFSTRDQILATASALLSQLDSLVVWREAGFEALAGVNTDANFQIDTGEAYQALQRAAALAAGYLIQSSFSLLPEKAIVLSEARTVLDLCAELYGSVDDEKLDLLISTNSLTGDEILELPQGRRVVYYPS
jgi:prophage DNA circulation protein